MGVFSQSAGQTYLDAIAARLQKTVDGANNQIGAFTQPSLWDQANATGDQDLLNDLGPTALKADLQSYPENYDARLTDILDSRPYVAHLAAFQNSVKAQAGYASLDAYLTAKAIQIHPLLAEFWRRNSLGPAISAANIFNPLYSCIACDKVLTGADGALVDQTAAAANATTADVTFLAAQNDCLYLLSRYPFNTAVIGMDTLGVGTFTPTFQYWNGNGYATLAVTDNSAAFTVNDTIEWTIPSDFEKTAKDGGGNYFTSDKSRWYAVRIQRTAAGAPTVPIASTIYIQPAAVTDGNGKHLGVPQGPLGLLRITATNAGTWEKFLDLDTSRFAPGTTVYLRALTKFAANLTVTFPYTLSGGAAGVPKLQAAWNGAKASLDSVQLTYSSPDTAIQGVVAGAAVVTVTSTPHGVFEVMATLLRTPAL